MLGTKQIVLVAGLSTLALATPLQQRQDDTGCMFFIDLMNDCKQMYGGSWDICKNPKNTFDIPDCNGEKDKKKTCEYMLNVCKKVYGGCYPAEGPIPLWVKPECP